MPLPSATLPRLRAGSRRARTARGRSEEALDWPTIAELSSTQISRMNAHELARMVRAARVPVAPVRLESLGRGSLERLAHRARLSCRNRLGCPPAGR